MPYLVRGRARSVAGGPSAWLLTEPLRELGDLAALLAAAPRLLAAPRGDGHGVLIFPGPLASDLGTGRLAGPTDRQVLFRPPLPPRPLYPRSKRDPR